MSNVDLSPAGHWQALRPHPLPWVIDAYRLEGRRLILFNTICLRVAVDPVSGCWEWTGPTSGSSGRGRDYARMAYMGQTVAVHRANWTIFHGYLPGKKQLDHICRNRKCINPFLGHTEPATHKQNCQRRDAARKGENRASRAD